MKQVGPGAAQAPEFIQQYTQRLGGWRDAYYADIVELDARAENLGQTRDEYIAALRANEEPEARQEGDHWAMRVVYLDALQTAYSDLAEAAPWMRVPAFVEHYNHRRCHESIGNVTPADAYFGQARAILNERRRIKEHTMKQRRLLNQRHAA